MDLALNNSQSLICHKSQPNISQPTNQPTKQPSTRLLSAQIEVVLKLFEKINIYIYIEREREEERESVKERECVCVCVCVKESE